MPHEDSIRLALEQVADYAIFVIDVEGRVATWNAGVHHVLGWNEEEWIGRPFAVVFHPEDAAAGEPEEELERARRTGRASDDRWHVRKDGTSFWASGLTTALRDPQGNVTGFLKVMRNLTERKRAEERQALHLAAATVLADAPALRDAVPKLLESMCHATGWRWGSLWELDPAGGVLRVVDTWCDPSAPLPEFERVSRSIRFERGAGLPGRAWASGTPHLIANTFHEENFPRRAVAADAGFRGALCFPITWGGSVHGVMEFFSDEIQPPDASLLATLEIVARQIGQFIDRHITAERLRASETLHAASIGAALDCVVSMDERGMVTEWNPAAEKTFGYSRDEAIHRELAELIIPPAFRQAHRDGLARYLATGEARVLSKRLELSAVRRDGTELPVELTIIRLPCEGPPAFTGFIRDLGEQRRTEDARRKSELRSQRLMEQSPLSIQIFAPDGTVRQVNRAWERLWGVTLVDLPDYNVRTDPQLAEAGVTPLVERAFAGEPVTVEPIAYRPDRGALAGEVRHVGAFIYPIKDEAGNVDEVVLVHEDVTVRRRAEAALAESEAKFRLLAETIPQLAWIARGDGHIVWYNRRWYDYTGTTAEQMEGWGWQIVHDPTVLPAVLDRWRASLATGEPFEMEFPLKGADGQLRPFLTRVAPLRDASGQVVQWFGTNTDVTDQRRIAEEREHLLASERTARTEAERASTMKDEFLATLSHELRTPLNAILGWAQILSQGDRPVEHLRDGLRTIERNARAQAQIIEDLLDMSRIIGGKVRLDLQRIELSELVQATMETIAPSASTKGIRIHAAVEPRCGPVSGDPARLQQVLWNLLSNAVKFTPKGGQVQVVLGRTESHVEIAIADTGQGIEPEFLPFVFDRFRQADASATRRHGGLGLGLSIVKQLVELHGGTVQASSPGAGRGTTVTVSLPVAADGDREVVPMSERRHPSSSRPDVDFPVACEMSGVKVLVVDDEPDGRALVRRLLEDCKATVLTASSADEAIALARSDSPDVLVCDIGMPGEDGYTLIRRIRALPGAVGRLPALALTAYARPEDRAKALLAGFQVHVAKPVEPAELIAMVASLAKR